VGLERNPDHEAHGTRTGYRKYGCRCEPCRGYKRRQNRRDAARRFGAPVPPMVHGTVNGYVNYGCGCPPCRAAGSKRNARQYRQRQSVC
jgi:hypothetical protein